jgi:hypothetical protein
MCAVIWENCRTCFCGTEGVTRQYERNGYEWSRVAELRRMRWARTVQASRRLGIPDGPSPPPGMGDDLDEATRTEAIF